MWVDNRERVCALCRNSNDATQNIDRCKTLYRQGSLQREELRQRSNKLELRWGMSMLGFIGCTVIDMRVDYKSAIQTMDMGKHRIATQIRNEYRE